VSELGEQIRGDYAGRPLTIVAILKGSVIFLADLARHLGHGVTIELIEASSYGDGTTSSGQVAIRRYGKLDVQGRDAILLDDIADTGNTLTAVRRSLEGMGARSVRTCVLLDKPCRRQVDLVVDYFGFEVGDDFVVGYGLDYDDYYRNLPDICTLRPEVVGVRA